MKPETEAFIKMFHPERKHIQWNELFNELNYEGWIYGRVACDFYFVANHPNEWEIIPEEEFDNQIVFYYLGDVRVGKLIFRCSICQMTIFDDTHHQKCSQIFEYIDKKYYHNTPILIVEN